MLVEVVEVAEVEKRPHRWETGSLSASHDSVQPSCPGRTALPYRPHRVTSGACSLSPWGTHAACAHGSG